MDIDTRSDDERSVEGIENDGVVDEVEETPVPVPKPKKTVPKVKKDEPVEDPKDLTGYSPFVGKGNDDFLYNPTKNSFKCRKHAELHFGNAEGMLDRHFAAKMYFKDHGLVDPKIKADKNDSEEESESETTDDATLNKINELLEERQSKSITTENLEDVVVDNLLKDIADGAAKVAKNPDLQFAYSHTKNIFPPNWTFEIWLNFLVVEALKNWGIRLNVYQNLEDLDERQLLMIKEAKLAWKEKQKVEVSG